MTVLKERGTLYLCATPLGNLEDITLRALRILKEVSIIAAEDTRHTRKLLSHFDIHTPLTSYHSHSGESKGEHLLQRLRQGEAVALVSDAGMPGISDPGAELVQQAVAEGIDVVPVPGPSAGIAALVVSGLSTYKFAFEGFLSNQRKTRRKQLQALKREQRTLIFYESPHRLVDSLKDMLAQWGERPCAVARELTKMHEEIKRGTLSEVLAYFAENQPRGEITLVVAGLPEEGQNEWESREAWMELPVLDHVALLEREGRERREAIKEVARLRGVPKREVYALVHDTGEQRSPEFPPGS